MASRDGLATSDALVSRDSGGAVALSGQAAHKPVVLPEEDYTSAMSDIVKRDFFPTLQEQDDAPDDAHNPAHQPYDASVSLDSFARRYTSEDNASFNAILDASNAARREKFAWAYKPNNKIDGTRALIEQREAEARHKRALAAPETDDRPRLADASSGSALATKASSNPDKSHRPPAALRQWEHNPLNPVMFGPNGSRARPDMAANLAAKQVHPENTRLEEIPVSPSRASSPSPSTIDRAITGARDPASPAVRGYGYVDDEIEGDPETLGAPQFTWGTLGATPQRVGTPGTPSLFTMAEEPARERVHKKLISDMQARRRSRPADTVRSGTVGSQRRSSILSRYANTPSFSSSPNPRQLVAAGARVGMTPAAQRLLARDIVGVRTTPHRTPVVKHSDDRVESSEPLPPPRQSRGMATPRRAV